MKLYAPLIMIILTLSFAQSKDWGPWKEAAPITVRFGSVAGEFKVGQSFKPGFMAVFVTNTSDEILYAIAVKSSNMSEFVIAIDSIEAHKTAVFNIDNVRDFKPRRDTIVSFVAKDYSKPLEVKVVW